MKRVFSISFFVLLSSLVTFSQSQNDSSNYTKRTLKMAPGKEYYAGWLHELFFGAHWRDLWTTPIKAEVLDLENFAGGLTPTKRGGGLQTKSLRFKGNDGREYKFRSINKDPKKVLDKELQESIAADIIQDQISSANPYAPLVVAPLLTAVGVLQAVPKLVLLPDNEKLGQFRKDFGGILGMIEINPEEEDIEGSDKIVGTVKLMGRLDKNHDEKVDSKEYLKARLMDIYFGDWDRHKDQWKWARFEENGKKFYRPIPRDRDQAFSEFDGLFPSIGESIVPQLNHFGSNYPNMKFMTWSGRYLDQRFLPFLDKGSWDSITNFVYEKLTDETIEKAVKEIPPEVYNKAKEELEEKLKSRRNQLKDASNEYYELVNKVIDIFGTDKKDYIEVNSVKDKTEVSIYKRNKETEEKEDRVLHFKMFDNNITDEIRIYLKDGDDKIIIKGNDNGSPLIRIIGGDGKDELIDNSEISIIFYDDGKKTKVKKGATTIVDKDKFKEPQDSLKKYLSKNENKLSKDEKEIIEEQIGNLKYDPKQIDRGSMIRFLPLFTYNPDIGPLLGGGIIFYKYGFRYSPYLYKNKFLAGYAPQKKGLSGLLLDYTGEFYGIIKNTQSNIHIRKSGIEVNNYFGRGNNTRSVDSLFDKDYYKAEHEEYILNPYIVFPAKGILKFSLGTLLKYFEVKQKRNTLLNSQKPYGTTEKLTLLAIQGGVQIDCRDHPTSPFKGFLLDMRGGYYPDIFNNRYEFGKFSFDVRGYLGFKTFTDISLALRTKTEKLWGTFPFFESAFLGGISSLRGFPSERFAGDGSIYGSAELRIKLFKMLLLFPETVGIFAFVESGKVFPNDEGTAIEHNIAILEDPSWHTGFGGGLYIYVINRDITFSLAAGKSKEQKLLFYFYTGFGF